VHNKRLLIASGIFAGIVVAAFIIAAAGWLIARRLSDVPLPAARDPVRIDIRSSAFVNDMPVPPRYTCDGANVSPPLSFPEPAPPGTQSFALIADDPDAPLGWVHWILYNLAPTTRALPANIAHDAQLPDGARQGVNSFGGIGYGGPCPPAGTVHHYFFTLFALDARLDLPPGATKRQLAAAMEGHLITYGRFVGRYARQK